MAPRFLPPFATCAAIAALFTTGCVTLTSPRGGFNVKDFGAAGDGQTLDSPAINRAIAAANAAGGGVVTVPAGNYLCGSLHLLSNVTLCLDSGSTVRATDDVSAYDPAEPNPEADKNQYEDFGHRHWHNSLIWADGATNIGVTGSGLIDGHNLVRNEGGKGDKKFQAGMANKAIALKNCRNVLLRDFSILYGGWFGILAIGTDNFTIENLRIDTNRDGMDIDSCRNVQVSDCSVNSPFDDGICLKATYGLGYNRACENITITGCHVSGFDVGTFLDGTCKRDYKKYSEGGPTGRIKFGTESNGGFKNVAVSNCTFDYCRGLALEEVDGGWLEDVSISNLTMRDITNSAIYVRLGSRNRGPAGAQTGFLRRVSISHIEASNVDGRFASMILGVPGHPIQGLSLSDIHIRYSGGGTAEQAQIDPPEKERDYPEPYRQGTMPAYGFYIRHAEGLTLRDIEVRTIGPDARPPIILNDVTGLFCDHLQADHAPGSPVLVLKGVKDLAVRATAGIPDAALAGAVPDGAW